MPTVSGIAPAVSASRCVTFDGRFPGTPSALAETEIDGFACAEAGSAHSSTAASASRRGIGH